MSKPKVEQLISEDFHIRNIVEISLGVRKGNWQASAWILGKINPEKWGEKNKDKGLEIIDAVAVAAEILKISHQGVSSPAPPALAQQAARQADTPTNTDLAGTATDASQAIANILKQYDK